METRIDEIFYKEIGKQLNQKRVMLGYSFSYLAKLTGISAKQLDNYFLGRYRITNDKYKVICNALGIKTEIKIKVDLGI